MRQEPRPAAPWMYGQCFDAAGLVFFYRLHWLPRGVQNIRLCHGLGERKGRPAVHAWLEGDLRGRRTAFDCNWWVLCDARAFRQSWSMTLVHEFTAKQALFLWALFDMPGPWDPRQLKIADAATAEREKARNG